MYSKRAWPETHADDPLSFLPIQWKYGEGTDAYQLVPLVLRQYSVAPYRGFSNMQANVVQIPLGYIRGMFKFGNTSLTSLEAANKSLSYEAVHRNLSWSFVGTIAGHRERPQMIEAFQDWYPHEIKTGLDPQSMREVYTNSKFVLVGRGQSSLGPSASSSLFGSRCCFLIIVPATPPDCYRVYEAVICGSVPVIVGSDDEVRRTFEFEGDFPPLVSSRDYPSALALCKAMTNEDIDNKRHELISWYKSRINYIMRKVDFVMTVFPG